MTLMLRDPILTDPFRAMDGFFGRVMGNGNRVTGWVPVLDVREAEGEYLVLVDLPGVKSEDVTIEVNDQVLTVSGSRVPVETGEAQFVERPYGSFVRTLTLPKGVDSDNIAANYSDGVLELRIPKPADFKPKKIEIGASSHKAIER